MDIDVLRQFPAAVRELRAVVREPEDIRRGHRTAFFAGRIEPMNLVMEQIHDDYTAAFGDLAELLATRRDLERASALMRGRQRAAARARLDADAFAGVIPDLAATDYLRERELMSMARFGMGIRDYLGALSPVDQRVTWYSAFIDSFEAMIRRGESPFGNHTAITSGTAPAELVRRAVDEAVRTGLPTAWREYRRGYELVRMELLR